MAKIRKPRVQVINFYCDYFRHPVIQRFVSLVGREYADSPLRLFAYCGEHSLLDGVLNDLSDSSIESICDWHGQGGKMIEALVKVGLLIKHDNYYQISEWYEHHGDVIRRKERASKAIGTRWAKGKNKRKVYSSNTQVILEYQKKQYSEDKPPTGIQLIIRAYKAAKNIDVNDRAWDKANFAVHARAAKKLLDACKGNCDRAMAYLVYQGNEWDEAGLKGWSLAAIAKHAWDGGGNVLKELDDKDSKSKEADIRTANYLAYREASNDPNKRVLPGMGESDHKEPLGPDRLLGRGGPPRATPAGEIAGEVIEGIRKPGPS